MTISRVLEQANSLFIASSSPATIAASSHHSPSKMRRHQGQLSQDFRFIPTPGQTGDLPPPVNFDDNSNLMAAAVGEVTTSSSSKLPVKRPPLSSVESLPLDDDGFQYALTEQDLELDPVDFNTDHFLDALEPIIKKYCEDPKHQELPAHGTVVAVPGVRKERQSTQERDKKYREKKKFMTQKLTEDVAELKMHHPKLGVFMEKYRNVKKQAIGLLFNMIDEGVRCNLKEEELWAQFRSPNGNQVFEIFWEENLKHKNELRTIVEMFVYLRQVVPPMAAPPVQEGLPSVNVDPFTSYLDGLDGIDDVLLQDPFDDEILFSDAPILEPDQGQVVLPESSTRKHKKSRKGGDKKYQDTCKGSQIRASDILNPPCPFISKDKKYCDKKKAELQKLKKDFEVMQTDFAKLEGFLKSYKNRREQAIAGLNIMIEEDFKCKLSKEELRAQFCSPNGKQTFDIYWKENMKYRVQLRDIVIMFLSHPL